MTRSDPGNDSDGTPAPSLTTDPGEGFRGEGGDLPSLTGQTPSPDGAGSSGQLKRVGFLLLNAWLIFHLFAIVICPASAEPSSPILRSGFEFVSPYLHALFLDHGFHYFAPDPGASTLVSYTLEFPDGTTKTGRIPDRDVFPRLFYHRHFMLTEFLGNGPEELQPLVERSFARNLCRASGATRVTLLKVVHDTVEIDAFRKGTRLNDPATFTESPLGTFTVEELRLPIVKVSKVPSTDSSDQSDSQVPDPESPDSEGESR